MARELAAALLLMTGACAQRMAQHRAVVPPGSETEINRTIEEAFQADSRSRLADSLYAPHAVIIADGTVRRTPPRFAGVGPSGEVAITSTQLEIRGTAAWGDVEYRWVSDRNNQVRVGRASFVLTPAHGRAGWWVAHVHSSIPK